jgi:tetratricopeptide (TPR) repeat protein
MHAGRRFTALCPGFAAIVLVAASLALGTPPFAVAETPGFFGIQPGTTIKAQVDLTLGEPLRRLSAKELAYEYRPVSTDSESSRIVVTFDDDTLAVARIDAYVALPFPPDAARARFGTRILVLDRDDGGREEIYYPQLQALVSASRAPGVPVVAVSFLSPRWVGRVFASRAWAKLDANAADQDARTEADKAVLVDPDGAAGYVAQGRCLLAAGNVDEAVVRFTAAASARHGQAERYAAHVWLARVATDHRPSTERALAEWQRAVAEAPPARRTEAMRLHAAYLRAQKRNDEAARQLTSALQIDATDIAVRRALVDLYWDTNQFAKALPLVAELAARTEAEHQKAHATDLFRHAYCLKEAGRVDEALASYDKFLALHGPSAGALNNIGVILLERGAPDAASERFRAGLSVNRESQTLNVNLTRALLNAGLHREALQHAETAAAAVPQDSARQLQVARCYGALKKKKEALLWLRRAVAAGLRDRSALTSDTYFRGLQDNDDFQALLAQTR